MTSPSRYVSRMLLFLLCVGALALLLYPAIRDAYVANVPLNSLILTVLFLGILHIVRQATRLGPEVRWLRQFQAAQEGKRVKGRPAKPVLLAPMARMLGDQKDRISLSALSMRSLLDGLSVRLDESREISRYLIGLLIFLGLLGTFWGLLQTVQSVGGVIGGLAVEDTETATFFQDLQRGLEAPLTGMGTAFSSSLFGLAGSLVLGFMELQASQAQNRFFQDVEDWLSGATRLGAGTFGDGEHGVSPYVQALLEQTAETLSQLQRVTVQSEDGRRMANASILALTEKLSTLTDQMKAEQGLMIRLAESLMEMRPLFARLSEAAASGGFGLDEASRQHLRNTDVLLSRLLDETSRGRAQAVEEIRNDIKLAARTMAAIAERSQSKG